MHSQIAFDLISAATGVAGQRVIVAVVKAMPPIPDGSSWGARWAYNALEAIAGLEAGSTGKADVPAK